MSKASDILHCTLCGAKAKFILYIGKVDVPVCSKQCASSALDKHTSWIPISNDDQQQEDPFE